MEFILKDILNFDNYNLIMFESGSYGDKSLGVQGVLSNLAVKHCDLCDLCDLCDIVLLTKIIKFTYNDYV